MNVLDKAEYQDLLDQIQNCVNKKDYQKAYTLAKKIDWKRVKSFRTLNMIADIYEINKDYADCKNVLLIARSRASVGKGILYRLVEVCLKLGDIDEAEGYYSEYVSIAANDNEGLILKYQLAKARNLPLDEQIDILEEFKDREYTEKWTYELALLYSKAGNKIKCVDVCDDMILWFSEGKYVLKAMELKKRYSDLTPAQQEYYDKEQRDSDPRLYSGEGNFAAGIIAKASPKETPVIKAEVPEPDDSDAELLEQKAQAAIAQAKSVSAPKRNSASVLERMNAAVAAVTAGVEAENTGVIRLKQEEVDKLSVTSTGFMGGTADLRSQLEKSVENVYGAPEITEGSNTPENLAAARILAQQEDGSSYKGAEEEIMNAGDGFAEDTAPLPDISAIPQEAGNVAAYSDTPASNETMIWNTASQMSDETSDVPQTGETAAEAPAQEPSMFAPKKDAPEPTFPAEWEIPDPEETPAERITHTLPLGKIGQNTVPISVEEVIRNETPEERRIRILNNANPTKMSDEQRQIFTYFARIPGMDTQILSAVTGVYKYAGEHTSRHGNIAVAGADGMGKTRLTYGLINMMCKDMGLDAVKVARVTGEHMNELDPAAVVARISGGFLAIEHPSDMKPETVSKLNQAMEFKTDCMIVILEDLKPSLRALFKKYPEFGEKFTGQISIPAFTNDELVTFARTYCQENNCDMDEMGVLALYTMISNSQTEEQPVSITAVKEMVDSAISHARRSGRKARKGPKGKKITLYEKDFII